jgi:hypothetical protein
VRAAPPFISFFSCRSVDAHCFLFRCPNPLATNGLDLPAAAAAARACRHSMSMGVVDTRVSQHGL